MCNVQSSLDYLEMTVSDMWDVRLYIYAGYVCGNITRME